MGTIHGRPQAPASATASAVAAISDTAAPEAPDAAIMGVVEAWTLLLGAISFELFGHYVGSVAHPEEHLQHLARSTASRPGIGRDT
ncbi:MAG: WHG domain-containing protein [Propioniciclava sp.]